MYFAVLRPDTEQQTGPQLSVSCCLDTLTASLFTNAREPRNGHHRRRRVWDASSAQGVVFLKPPKYLPCRGPRFHAASAHMAHIAIFFVFFFSSVGIAFLLPCCEDTLGCGAGVLEVGHGHGERRSEFRAGIFFFLFCTARVAQMGL